MRFIICLSLFFAFFLSSILVGSNHKDHLSANKLIKRYNDAVSKNISNAQSSVVSIKVYISKQHQFLSNSFFHRLYTDHEIKSEYFYPRNLGSGVILDSKKGYLVTNNHVVEGAAKILVTLSNGVQRIANVVGVDSYIDLAVLSIKAKGLTAISKADIKSLQVGSFVYAIGSPYGLRQTVTSGIVSALGRNNLGIDSFENFIQTDASINSGNSGGALIDSYGDLVGINTAILGDKGNIGIGFAIPADMVFRSFNQIIDHGSIRRGYFGALVKNINQITLSKLNLSSTNGALVVSVDKDSSAEIAGVKKNDVILSINGVSVKNSESMYSLIRNMDVGSKISLSVLRGNKKLLLKCVLREF